MEDYKQRFRDWGREGGLKGGPARNAALSPWKRKQIAKKARKHDADHHPHSQYSR